MKNVLILTGNLVQDHEFIYPYFRVQEEGYYLEIGIRGGVQVNGIIGTKVPPNGNTARIKDICSLKIDDYDLLIIPGGAKAMEYMRQDQAIIKYIYEFNNSGKVIASICHGAQLLISAKIVSGRKISGYYSIKDDLINAGAIYTDEPAVIDQNIVSTAHYKDLGPWMKAALNLVKD